MSDKPNVNIYIFEDSSLPWAQLCAKVHQVNQGPHRAFSYTLHASGKEGIEGPTSYKAKRELIGSLGDELAIFIFDLDYEDKLKSGRISLNVFNQLDEECRRLLFTERFGVELIGSTVAKQDCAGLIVIASNIAVADKFNVLVGTYAEKSDQRLHWHHEPGSLSVSPGKSPEKLGSVIAKFESLRGEPQHRLLPWLARKWFSGETPSPDFMRHNWKNVPPGEREQAIAKLTEYFCSLVNEKTENVQKWLIKTTNDNAKMDGLWENLKTIVGACSKVHVANGNRFLSFPALAFVLGACCNKGGFAVLTGADFPFGLAVSSRIIAEDAKALLSDLIKCFTNLASGDGPHRAANEQLVIGCQTSASSFLAEFDIPFNSIDSKLKELEKAGDFVGENSGSCAPLARIRDRINKSPSAILKVSASTKGKTVICIEAKTKGKRG